MRGDRGLSTGFYGVPEWWLWRWVRRALGQLLARPARSWTLGGKDNFMADQAVAGQVAAAYPDVLVAVRGRGSRAWRLRVTVAGSGIRSWYRFPCPWAALFLAHASPHAVVPPGVQREGQALPTDGAAGADRFRLGDLVQGGARRGEREEQFRIGVPACSQLPPVPVGDGDSLVAQRSGRGCHLRAWPLGRRVAGAQEPVVEGDGYRTAG